MPHHVACRRAKLSKVPVKVPGKWIAQLEQNQQIAHCCRNPEEYDHEIEAFYSSDADRDRGVPDVYVFHCSGCGRKHTRFCLGGTTGFKVDHLGEFVLGPDGKPLPHEEPRPFWEIR
jgi:hypothetical protein